MKSSARTGRPSGYSEELAVTICDRIAGGESLKSICDEDGMPSQSMVFRWLADDRHSSFREIYVRAREAQADALFDEILDIADDGSNDWMERRREDGSLDVAVDHEHISRSKLRVDTRKWMAAKLAPKKYGEKVQHTGADGEGPVQIEHSTAAREIETRLKRLESKSE